MRKTTISDAPSNPGRRRVLSGATGAGAIAALSSAGGAHAAHLSAVAGALAPGTRYTSVVDVVNLDGAFAGIVRAMEGGNPVAELSPYAQRGGPGSPLSRFVTGVRYQPMKVEFESGMSPAWYQWVASAANTGLTPTARSGEVLSATATGTLVGRLAFRDALISEVKFPALDAAAKNPDFLSVTVQPGSTQFDARTGAISVPIKAGGKAWSTSTFRVTIPALKGALPIRAVEAITFRTRLAQSDRARVANGVEVSNLVVRINASHALPFYKWFDEFMTNPSADRMYEGSVEIVNLQNAPIARVSFQRLGIVRVAPMRVSGSPEQASEVEVEMFSGGAAQMDLSQLA